MRFLSKSSQLYEQWCAFVPGSQKAEFPLEIGDLVEQTDDFEIYEATDMVAGLSSCKVKVYLDKKVQARGNLLLGRSTDCEVDVNGNPYNKPCVFEVVEGWDDYVAWCRTASDSGSSEQSTTDAVTEDESSDEEHYEEYVDEDTGQVYRQYSDGHREDQKEDGTYESDTKKTFITKKMEKTKETSPNRGFAAVAGMDELKQQLTNEVLWPLKHKELMEQYKLHSLNGMLLYGPPGCGKTYIAQKFAEESGMHFKFVSAGSLGSHYIHDTATNIKNMFEEAKNQSPCILCIDEIDSLLPDRSQVGVEGACSDLVESVNEFLSHMNNCSKDGIFVIGSTNNPYALDGALLRTGRMDKLIYVGMPDEESRKALLEYCLKGRPQDEGIDMSELAKLTDGMNASDIEFMVNSVAMASAMSQTPISFENLASQAKTQRRSVYVSKSQDSEEQVKISPAYTKVMGFSQNCASKEIAKKKTA